MEIHIDKNKTKERNSLTQLLRISSATECYEIRARYELNERERKLLNEDPRLKDKIAVEYEKDGSDLSPTVEQMVGDGWRFVAYSARELKEMENRIKDNAETLKGLIEEIDDTEGSSTIQI